MGLLLTVAQKYRNTTITRKQQNNRILQITAELYSEASLLQFYMR